MAVAATKAQIAALRWLIAKGLTTKIRSSQLAGLYEERARAEHEASEIRTWGFRPGTDRMHGWRRTSGRVLAAMEKAGLVAHDGWDRYTPRYKITEAGREAAKEA